MKLKIHVISLFVLTLLISACGSSDPSLPSNVPPPISPRDNPINPDFPDDPISNPSNPTSTVRYGVIACFRENGGSEKCGPCRKTSSEASADLQKLQNEAIYYGKSGTGMTESCEL